MRLYAIACGWITMPLDFLLDGEAGTLRVPVPSYLIDHPKGKVLFDSGLNLAAQADAAAYLGPMSKHFEIEFEAGEEIGARLAGLDVAPRDIRYLVVSHLHFDHVGGNAQVADAPLVVQRREWQAGRQPDAVRRHGYKPEDYDLGHDVIQVDGEHDLFGDGAVVCLPSHGHTPGHQSLRLRLGNADVVLAGDACYLRRSLEDLHLPRYGHDHAAMRRSLERLRALEARGARIFYGHDPMFWESLAKAPRPVAP
jgi:glyoxylase-like metal-dependent hydrolase (beta-lactamase superfamily II)